jgi:hypothetical protein
MILRPEQGKGNTKFMFGSSPREYDAFYMCHFRPRIVLDFLRQSRRVDEEEGIITHTLEDDHMDRELPQLVSDEENEFQQPQSDPAEVEIPPLPNRASSPPFGDGGEGRRPFVLTPLTRLPVDDDALHSELLPTLASLHLKSRTLGRLPRFTAWHSQQKVEWRAALVKETKLLEQQLDQWDTTHSQLLLLNIVLRYISIPVRILLPLTYINDLHPEVTVTVQHSDFSFAVPAHSGSSRDWGRTNAPSVEHSPDYTRYMNDEGVSLAAIKAFKSGRRKIGKKILEGNGMAPRSARVSRQLSDLHPNYNIPVPPFDPGITGSCKFKLTDTIDKLTRDAGKIASADPFGWTPDLLACLRNRQPTEAGEDYIRTYARLIRALSCHSFVPRAVAFVIGTGVLSPLNKVEPELNEQLATEGKDLKIRPVNGGTYAGRLLGRNIYDNNGGKSINRRLPHQYQGVSDGSQKVALIASAAYADNMILQKNDNINAFNRLARWAVIDAAKTEWKDAYPIIYTYYSVKSPIFFLFHDDNGILNLQVNLSCEGVKQGDIFGSIGFNITVEKFIYKPLRTRYPDVRSAANTDDLLNIWHPPETNTQEDWDCKFKTISEYMATAETLAIKVGILYAIEKRALLIPEWGFLPSNPIAENGIKLNVIKEGMIIAGTPVGTATYTASIIDEKITKVQNRSTAASKLARECPQVFMCTTIQGTNQGLDYLTGALGPAAFSNKLKAFDDWIFKNVTGTLDIDTSLMNIDKLITAKWLARLPTSLQGAGLVSTDLKAAVNFLCKVIACMSDNTFSRHCHALLPQVKLAYEQLCGNLGIQRIDPSHPLAAILPASAEEILTPVRAPLAPATFKPFGRIKTIMNYLHSRKRIQLISRALKIRNKVDKAHLLAILTSSQFQRLFTLDYSEKFHRLDADNFRHTVAFFLGLPSPATPALLSDASFNAEHGCQVATCKLHGKIIDPNGVHASSCTHCYLARSALHRDIVSVCAHHLKRANFQVTKEPSIGTIVGPIGDSITGIFPKRPNSQSRKSQRLVDNFLASANGKTSSLQEVQAVIAKLPRIPPDKEGALRLDIHAVPEDGKGPKYAVDVTCIHTTCNDYIKKQLAESLIKAEQEIDLAACARKPGVQRINSHALQKAVVGKTRKYGLVVKLADLLSNARPGASRTSLVPAALSHSGEFSVELLDLIENCTNRFKRIQRSVFDINGHTLPQRVALYRMSFKNSLIARLADGVGNLLQWAIIRGSAG